MGRRGWLLEVTRHSTKKINEQRQKHVKRVVKNEAGGRKINQNWSKKRPKLGLGGLWGPPGCQSEKRHPKGCFPNPHIPFKGSQNGAKNCPKTRQKNKRKKGGGKTRPGLRFAPFWNRLLGAFSAPQSIRERPRSDF